MNNTISSIYLQISTKHNSIHCKYENECDNNLIAAHLFYPGHLPECNTVQMSFPGIKIKNNE